MLIHREKVLQERHSGVQERERDCNVQRTDVEKERVQIQNTTLVPTSLLTTKMSKENNDAYVPEQSLGT